MKKSESGLDGAPPDELDGAASAGDALKMRRHRSATEKKPILGSAAGQNGGLSSEKADHPPSVGILRAKGERRQRSTLAVNAKPYAGEEAKNGER